MNGRQGLDAQRQHSELARQSRLKEIVGEGAEVARQIRAVHLNVIVGDAGGRVRWRYHQQARIADDRQGAARGRRAVRADDPDHGDIGGYAPGSGLPALHRALAVLHDQLDFAAQQLLAPLQNRQFNAAQRIFAEECGGAGAGQHGADDDGIVGA